MAKPDTLSVRVADELRAEMARQRKTFADLVPHVYGVSPATLRRKLSGQYPFDLDELEQIATALGVPSEDFVGRASPDRTPA